MTGVCASTWMCNAHAGSQTPPSLQKPKVTKVESSLSKKIALPSDNQQPRTYDPIPVPTHLPGAHSLSSFSRLPTAWEVLSPASSPIHAPTSRSSPAPVKQPFESDRDSVNAWLLVQHPAYRTTEPSRHPTCNRPPHAALSMKTSENPPSCLEKVAFFRSKRKPVPRLGG